MRNQYPGTCYRCGGHVEAGAGHFERRGYKAPGVINWELQHAGCAIAYRDTKVGKGEPRGPFVPIETYYTPRKHHQKVKAKRPKSVYGYTCSDCSFEGQSQHPNQRRCSDCSKAFQAKLKAGEIPRNGSFLEHAVKVGSSNEVATPSSGS